MENQSERPVELIRAKGTKGILWRRNPRIGWWGKSSNILVPGAGSLVVLGAVITDAVVAPDHDEPVPDGCSTCMQCLTGCPTGAIIDTGVIDARKCLAWLVQTDGEFLWQTLVHDLCKHCTTYKVCTKHRNQLDVLNRL